MMMTFVKNVSACFSMNKHLFELSSYLPEVLSTMVTAAMITRKTTSCANIVIIYKEEYHCIKNENLVMSRDSIIGTKSAHHSSILT